MTFSELLYRATEAAIKEVKAHKKLGILRGDDGSVLEHTYSSSTAASYRLRVATVHRGYVVTKSTELHFPIDPGPEASWDHTPERQVQLYVRDLCQWLKSEL